MESKKDAWNKKYMVGILKDCFTHAESEKFINILKCNLRCNLYSNDKGKLDWLRYELSQGRPSIGFARRHIVEPIQKAEHFPLYILLNIVTDDTGQKHSIAMVVIPKRSLDKKYHLLLFDSNGHIDRHGEIYEQKIYQVIDAVKNQLDLEITDLMSNKSAINTIGRGFCDALVLYFIYINVINGNSSVKHITDELNMWLSHFDKDKSKQISNVLQVIRSIVKHPKSLSMPMHRLQT